MRTLRWTGAVLLAGVLTWGTLPAAAAAKERPHPVWSAQMALVCSDMHWLFCQLTGGEQEVGGFTLLSDGTGRGVIAFSFATPPYAGNAVARLSIDSWAAAAAQPLGDLIPTPHGNLYIGGTMRVTGSSPLVAGYRQAFPAGSVPLLPPFVVLPTPAPGYGDTGVPARAGHFRIRTLPADAAAAICTAAGMPTSICTSADLTVPPDVTLRIDVEHFPAAAR